MTLIILHSPQLSFNPYNTFTMSNASSIPPEIIESSNQDNGERQVSRLRCTYPDCSEDRDFRNESALRYICPLLTKLSHTSTWLKVPSKHQEKHSKPYICQLPNCKFPRFGDKAGLGRHKREVHGPNMYYCPIVSCKRHTKGFSRTYNLSEHRKRCHPAASASMQRSLNHTHIDGVLPDDLGRGNKKSSSSETTKFGDVARLGSWGLEDKLKNSRLYEQNPRTTSWSLTAT